MSQFQACLLAGVCSWALLWFPAITKGFQWWPRVTADWGSWLCKETLERLLRATPTQFARVWSVCLIINFTSILCGWSDWLLQPELSIFFFPTFTLNETKASHPILGSYPLFNLTFIRKFWSPIKKRFRDFLAKIHIFCKENVLRRILWSKV